MGFMDGIHQVGRSMPALWRRWGWSCCSAVNGIVSSPFLHLGWRPYIYQDWESPDSSWRIILMHTYSSVEPHIPSALNDPRRECWESGVGRGLRLDSLHYAAVHLSCWLGATCFRVYSHRRGVVSKPRRIYGEWLGFHWQQSWHATTLHLYVIPRITALLWHNSDKSDCIA